MLEARTALSEGTGQGLATTAPTLAPGVSVVARPTPWQTVRPNRYLHGTSDVTPFAAGGPLPARADVIQRRLPGQLGLFGAPDVGVSSVLVKPFDPKAPVSEGGYPGFVELPGTGLVVPPKLSPQDPSRATPISVAALEQLGPAGPVIRRETPPPPGKRHRTTVIPQREDGAVLLVKGKGDSLWGLPGGDVKPGEASADAGVRELREETGLGGTNAARVFSLDSPGTFHDVSTIDVAGEGTPAALQAKEIEDYRWWKPSEDKALPLSRSTRTILEEHLRVGLPRTGDTTVIPGREAWDWWPQRAYLGELEGVLPVGADRRPLDPALSRPILGGVKPEGGETPRVYLEEGADPITRRQIARANIRQLAINLGLRPPPGVTFETAAGTVVQTSAAAADPSGLGVGREAGRPDQESRDPTVRQGLDDGRRDVDGGRRQDGGILGDIEGAPHAQTAR